MNTSRFAVRRFWAAWGFLTARAVVCWLGVLLIAGSLSNVADAADRKTRRGTVDDSATGLDDPTVNFINQQIRIGWEDNEVEPSPLADDAEWLRRVSLDLTGRVPTRQQVTAFLRDDDPAKRTVLIDTLLDSPEFIGHWATQWTNLLIGRQPPRQTNRDGLLKFLRDSVALGRPWDDVVSDLLTAEGNFEENGAVNFLLAKLDGNPRDADYHVEATASVTRLLLGMQVQCTQCHNHPFNDWKQDQFWEFNAFLRQIRRRNVRDADGNDLYSELLGDLNTDGPVFFEKRSGLMQVAYPNYFGESITHDRATDRRSEFAKLVTGGADGENLLAKAFVNRTWSQLFGYGLTKPVDDMGPHNPPSHPEVLDHLANEFVASGYDVRQLFRWIANTEAYNLTSSFNRDGSNSYDDPAAGEVPLFSHMYVKGLTAEQLYDSLVIAAGTDAAMARANDRERAARMRQRWLQDFLRIFGGSDDEEPTLFSGSIPQALLMMNGPLVQNALEGDEGTVLRAVLNDPKLRDDADRIEQLYFAALGRRPSRKEASGLRKAFAQTGGEAKLWLYQDLYWALLNSNEFIFNH